MHVVLIKNFDQMILGFEEVRWCFTRMVRFSLLIRRFLLNGKIQSMFRHQETQQDGMAHI